MRETGIRDVSLIPADMVQASDWHDKLENTINSIESITVEPNLCFFKTIKHFYQHYCDVQFFFAFQYNKLS